MAYFICEKQGRCCPHEFYNSIEQAISDSEDGVPCDHLIEVDHVRHGRWIHERTEGGFHIWRCNRCGRGMNDNPEGVDLYCYHCGAKMDEEVSE